MCRVHMVDEHPGPSHVLSVCRQGAANQHQSLPSLQTQGERSKTDGLASCAIAQHWASC